MRASEGRFVMTAHMQDKCVLIYPENEWETTILPQIQGLPSFSRHVQRAQRLLIGLATAMELDANGRVLVPPTLREYAELEKKLKLVGIGNKLELWGEQAWGNDVADVELNEEMPQEMLKLTL